MTILGTWGVTMSQIFTFREVASDEERGKIIAPENELLFVEIILFSSD